MSVNPEMNESEIFSAIKSLGNYLKAVIEVTSGIIESNIRRGSGRETIQREGHNVKVKIKNTAPIEQNYPLVVFMGVGLKIRFPVKTHRTFTRMKNENDLRVDLSNAPNNPFPVDEAERIDSPDYAPFTNDERKHGYILFPGEYIVYELGLTLKECPDIKALNLWVEGTISRRHLLHHSKKIEVTSENVIIQL